MSAAELAAPGQAVGPRRFWVLVMALARNEFRLRYFGSTLGYAWSLARPLMLFGILYVVFTEIVRFGEGIEHYPLKLLIGIVLFTYFIEVTSAGVRSLVQNETLLRKMAFPRSAIPLSVGMTSLFNLALSLLVVLGFALLAGVSPEPSWLQLVPIVVVLVLLATSLGALLSVLFVSFRDVQPIWEVLGQALFWGSAIIYVSQSAPDAFQSWLGLNPLVLLIEQARHALVDPAAPTAVDVAGSWGRLLAVAGAIAALCVVSWSAFRRAAPRIAERL